MPCVVQIAFRYKRQPRYIFADPIDKITRLHAAFPDVFSNRSYSHSRLRNHHPCHRGRAVNFALIHSQQSPSAGARAYVNLPQCSPPVTPLARYIDTAQISGNSSQHCILHVHTHTIVDGSMRDRPGPKCGPDFLIYNQYVNAALA